MPSLVATANVITVTAPIVSMRQTFTATYLVSVQADLTLVREHSSEVTPIRAAQADMTMRHDV